MEKGLTFFKTADGSWTASFSQAGERMHHSAGAFSETQYIYGTAIQSVIAARWPPSFLSVGLGLGHIEILLAALLSRAPQVSSARVQSFESQPLLRQQFETWVLGRAGGISDFVAAYEDGLARAARVSGAAPEVIRETLHSGFISQRWELRGALPEAVDSHTTFSAVLFDAFSRATSPELWDEAFLEEFLSTVCAEKCYFATYASTNRLRRVLKKLGFSGEVRRGFADKRESTFLVRSGS